MYLFITDCGLIKCNENLYANLFRFVDLNKIHAALKTIHF